MKGLSGFFATVLLLFSSSPAHALDQGAALRNLSDFLAVEGPQLFEGHDEIGDCRLFIYGQDDGQSQDLWIEGTFQKRSGPVAGMVLPFLASSSPEKALIQSFSVQDDELQIAAAFSSENGLISMGLQLKRSEGGALQTARYEASGTFRTCSDLSRKL